MKVPGNGVETVFLNLNKMGEITVCLCVCGSDPIEGQFAHVRVREEGLDRCS